jgi:hypothetical protein
VGLLGRGYFEQGIRLLKWGALFFAGLTVNNIVLFIDVVMLPDIDLRLARLIPTLIGVSCLVYGLLWDSEADGTGKAGRQSTQGRTALPGSERHRQAGESLILATPEAQLGPDRILATD